VLSPFKLTEKEVETSVVFENMAMKQVGSLESGNTSSSIALITINNAAYLIAQYGVVIGNREWPIPSQSKASRSLDIITQTTRKAQQ